MSDILTEIVQRTRQRLEAQKQGMPAQDLEARWKCQPPARPFAQTLHRSEGLAIIAELKQASPSAGIIRQEDNIEGRIKGYEAGGAAALSILTEEDYFRGSPQFLELARRTTTLPLLRKDFIIDHYQIDESRVLGADAILLITAILDGSLLKECLRHAAEAGLEALVEVHDEADLQKALLAEAPLIGINNRDLHTLRVDLTASQRLLPLIPKKGKTLVVESGIKDPKDLRSYRGLGVHAVLIGEALMRHRNAKIAVESFVRGGANPEEGVHD